MTKILVLSDSHGDIDNMKYAVMKEKPNLIFHLGDCVRDAEALRRVYPSIPMCNVAGNCDFEGEAEHIVEIDGVNFMMCHGHAYNVKSTYLSIEMAAHEKGADVVLFGHTHRVFYDNNNGLLMLNPGSIGNPPWGIPASYATLQVDDMTGQVDYEIHYLEE